MSFPQIFQTKRDAGGAWLDTLPVSNNTYSVELDAATAVSFLIPGIVANWAVRFNVGFTSVVWMSADGNDAAGPAGDTIALTNSTLLVPGRMYYIPANTEISLLSPDADTIVGIELYAINQI